MKNMKKKGLLLGALSVLCLSSVGFASWVITNNDTKTAGGNITVETVKNNAVKLDVNLTAGSTIHFGHESKKNTQLPDWLKVSGVGESVLTAKVQIKVTNYSGLKDAADAIKVTVAEKTGDESYKSKNIDAQFIQLPEAVNISKTQVTDGDGTVTADLTFKWGTLFGGNCPEDFFKKDGTHNLIDGDSGVASAGTNITGEYSNGNLTNGQLAEYVLKTVEGYKDAQFVVTVAATAAAE